MKPSGVREIDVVVFGGGPAGAAAARVLAERGYSTVVVEQSDYGDARIGETLPPAIEPLLQRLGYWDRFVADNHSPSAGIRSAWGREELYTKDFIFNPYGMGWHVQRNRFDSMLASAAEDAGASVYRGAEVVLCVQDNDRNWQVEIRKANRRLRFRAGFAIDATGRRAWFARKQGARRIISDYLIGAAVIVAPRRPTDSFTLIEAAEDGWWYSAALPDSCLIVMFMTDADMWAKARRELAGCWLGQLAKTKHTQARVGQAALDSKPRVVAANSSRLDRIADGNWLAAGDAAMAFDPLSGQGVYKALESALRASEAIDRHRKGEASALGDYAKATRRDFERYQITKSAFYSTEQRWPGSTFWERRTAGRQADFARRADAVVSLES